MVKCKYKFTQQQKNEMVIFKSKFEGDLKTKFCGKRLYPTESVKYLGVKIDSNFSWQYHGNDLSIKLNRANALLLKMRKYASLKTLLVICFPIFDSYLFYCCLVLGQNHSTAQWIVILQEKAVRFINSEPSNSRTSPLFKQNSILKFQDKICLENILFVSKSLNNLTHQFLVHGLVLPQINITMKPQVLHRVTSQDFFIKQIYMGSIQSL